MILALCLHGCASVVPDELSARSAYRERGLSQSDGPLKVTTSVLSAEESRAVYGVPLAEKRMQPVWIEVENRDNAAYWLMSPGLDPDFFPASEAAEAFTDKKNNELAQRFTDLAFENPIPPQTTVSGMVLTNLDLGVKIVEVDLLSNGRHSSMLFLNSVPGFRADYDSRKAFVREFYAPGEMQDFSDAERLRAALEELPCCVTNSDGSRNGDPLNLVVVGDQEDAFPALIRRGWRPTEQTWIGSVGKMIRSVFAGERYPYSPISPLYLFGRPQDLALQRARDNIHQRNHLRLWRSPMRYQGKSVWVGQISRDIGTRLTIHSPYLTTHKIDPDVDEARTALVEDIIYSQNLTQFGLVKGVGAAPKSAPRGNLTTDPYYTDGWRAVLVFDSEPRSLDELEFLPWEGRTGGVIEQGAK